LDIMVNVGETVTKDQALLVLEAMKMENVIKSPGDGKIKSISIQKANTVEKNQVMINFE
jgi:biotin carboxyl carrier protein